jgi:hypothetical protein
VFERPLARLEGAVVAGAEAKEGENENRDGEEPNDDGGAGGWGVVGWGGVHTRKIGPRSRGSKRLLGWCSESNLSGGSSS